MQDASHVTRQSDMSSGSQSLAQPLLVTTLDEWKGVTDPTLRRRIQNRINQRLSRGRKRATNRTRCTKAPKAEERWLTPEMVPCILKYALADLEENPIFGPTAKKAREIMRTLEAAIHAEFALGSPQTDMLMGLTRLNILRAINTNTDILGYDSSCLLDDDALSPFAIGGPGAAALAPGEELLPVALRPTHLQRTVPHHPWIDVFPFPRMRDIMILAENSYDDQLLCQDMLGDRCSDLKREGRAGLLVWKDPWDPTGWEITPAYMKLWGWTVQGCWELFLSTNAWRARRGEKPLFNLPDTVGADTLGAKAQSIQSIQDPLAKTSAS